MPGGVLQLVGQAGVLLGGPWRGTFARRAAETRRALADGHGAGGADGLHGMALGQADHVGAEGRLGGVGDDDADLPPRLDDGASGVTDGALGQHLLPGVGDLDVDEVAHEQAVRGADRDGRGRGVALRRSERAPAECSGGDERCRGDYQRCPTS